MNSIGENEDGQCCELDFWECWPADCVRVTVADNSQHSFQSTNNMSSRSNNNQLSSSMDKDNQDNPKKQQVEYVTMKKHEVQYAKPTALVSHQKRDDIKPMFSKPSGSGRQN
uniref:Uncharacterized protein n=1 Tax=Schizaphis graminum TaxID=13262 RepID=A0A2S2P2A2_SCHGA